MGIHPDKTKILRNQDEVKAKEITVDNIKIEVLGKGDSARYLGQKITFEEQETEEIKKQKTEGGVGSVPKILPRTNLEKLPSVSQTTSFQHDHHADNDLRKWHMDVITKARKDDQDSAT